MIAKRGLSLGPPAIVDVPTTPEERAANRAEHERFLRNVAWFNAHSAALYRDHRGKYVCVAGEELFVGEDPGIVFAEAAAKHPADRGAMFRWHVSTYPGPAIHAHLRHVGRA